ncbi:MAG: gliding motility protein GldC [Saprospiraceae bacterium]|nr:gliding motility protein GldC [Saprospiraceae bacterium]
MAEPIRSSQIRITVNLDEKNMPTSIDWDADDRTDGDKPIACKAMMLSLFERDTLDTMKIDLWATDMQVNEMDRFVFQSLRAMADTYFKATQNRELAVDMQRFVHYFGEKTGILKAGE